MQDTVPIWSTPEDALARTRPDRPVLFFSPERLQRTVRRFQAGFPGLVTYAVKANDRREVLDNLVAAGLTAFDVASPAEMAAVRAACPTATLHYHNPVRSHSEVSAALGHGIASWSVDDLSELDKLRAIPPASEIAVRFALPVGGAAYDFGAKFGATPQSAVALLRKVVELGFTPSLTFHPGTQCEDPEAWERYIDMAAQIASEAGVSLKRLNVGGGFPAQRGGQAPDLEHLFERIDRMTQRCFGPNRPDLVCEPGRAMVADAFSLAAQVKSIRSEKAVFLNDGLYGGLADLRDMVMIDRLRVVSPQGAPRQGSVRPFTVFGPTCDSLDQLPHAVPLPSDIAPGDYVVIDGMGAYSIAMSTGFNGYSLRDIVTVRALSGQ